MADEKTTKPEDTDELRDVRAPDFAQRYANNVRFEGSAWDLRMMFGTLDQADNIVAFHTAMNIPWAQAKLMLYYLYVHVQFQEEANGRFRVPSSLVPRPVGTALPHLAADPKTIPMVSRIERMADELFGRSQVKADDEAS